MALTEAEKRKLLRERRAAKVKDGSSRLGKITGDRTGLETVDHQAESAKTTSEVPEISNVNRRISRAFDGTQSEGIANTSKPQANVDLNDEEEFERELQKIQAFLHKEQQHGNHEHLNEPSPFPQLNGFNNEANDQFNVFGDQFSQLQALLNGTGNPEDFENLFNGNGNGNEFNNSKGQSAEEIEYNKNLKAYNKQQNSNSKAQFLLFKFIVVSIITIWGFFSYDHHFNRVGLDVLTTSYNTTQFKAFTVFEILTTFVIFFKLARTADDEYDYKYSSYLYYLQFIPEAFLSSKWKQRVRLSVKYLEILQFILFDLSVIVVITGILSTFL